MFSRCALHSPHSSPSPASSPPFCSPSAHRHTPAKANTWDPTNSSAGGNNSPFRPNPPAPPVRPSATIKLLQEQLGQLNYYNGPVTGYMNHGTVQAIMYLQHDAHLPQTGQLNTATENALNSMLANGNNQMGGNTNTNHMNTNN
jgi:peptidoglycan hydrolase-like protein with peptidoglycan-binding domain